MKRIITAALLLLLISLSACQKEDITDTTTGALLETPTTTVTLPTTTAPKVTVPGTSAVPTEPTEPLATNAPTTQQQLTPQNETPYNSQTMQEKFVYCDLRSYDSIYTVSKEVQLGATAVDAAFLDVLSRYEDDNYFHVAICYGAMVTEDTGENATLRKMIMQRFRDAGYTINTGAADQSEYALFTIFATKAQILEMYCGTDLAICISASAIVI